MVRGLAAAFLLLCLPHVAGAAFAGVRPEHGSIVLLDARSGSEIERLVANGAIVTAIADGRRGWFVGGSFTRMGGHRRVALAHLLPSGAVDPTWRASISSASGRPVAVYNLARAGSRLFVAGPFGRVGGLQRPGLAAVDTANGAVVRGWSPKPAAWLDVHELLVAGPRLLVARQIGYPKPGITALDVRTGAVDRRWDAHLRPIPGAGSFSTLVLRGPRVYVAGSFHVAGLSRNGLVAVDARSGRPDRRFAPRVPNCSICNGFAVLYGLAASDRRLYVSGHFERVAGVPRNGIAALDPRTGAIDLRWRPARARRDILDLALVGSRLYLGGRAGLYALDARNGVVVPLPHIASPREILSLAVSGRRLLVTGRD
jgi:hypothetical protein